MDHLNKQHSLNKKIFLPAWRLVDRHFSGEWSIDDLRFPWSESLEQESTHVLPSADSFLKEPRSKTVCLAFDNQPLEPENKIINNKINI